MILKDGLASPNKLSPKSQWPTGGFIYRSCYMSRCFYSTSPSSLWTQAARAVSIWNISMAVEAGNVVNHTLGLKKRVHISSVHQHLCHF